MVSGQWPVKPIGRLEALSRRSAALKRFSAATSGNLEMNHWHGEENGCTDGERGRIRTFDPCLNSAANPITNNNLHVQLTPCTTQQNSMSCEQDIGLGVRRVPAIRLRMSALGSKPSATKAKEWPTMPAEILVPTVQG